MLIDTHCHLHDPEWFTPEQQAEFLEDAARNGVEQLICIGTEPDDSRRAQTFATQHESVYWTYGIHPEFADRIAAPPHSDADLFTGNKLVAIGEIGLDYHYDGDRHPAQIRLFEQMLQLARDYKLPVALHLREAFADAFAVLDNFPEVTGVVHSFTGSKKDLRRALDRGFAIGVNGLATYTTLPLPPLDNMVLETDAPFLTPNPFRGTINKPGYVRVIAAYLAEKLGVAESEIREQTTKNARKIFQI